MLTKITITFSLLLISLVGFSQHQGDVGRPDIKAPIRSVRVVDTLTAKEKQERNPILLKTEVDSLIRQWQASQPPPLVKEPEPPKENAVNQYILAALAALIFLVILAIYLFYKHQKKINRTIAGLNAKEKQREQATLRPVGKDKVKENVALNQVTKDYNGLQHEYEAIKQGILKAYKVKNYPGVDKSLEDGLAIQSVLQTETEMSSYAYEKFLKPIFSIVDANKNSPARISDTDRLKLLDLLISLSLLYIEYLYLRVNDLAIGGQMVDRIKGISKGAALDTSRMKKMNTEFGSRALVIKMVLEKAGIHQLAYPVFDETNLNNQ